MQWSADRNAGFSRANPQQLYLPVIIDPEYHYEAVNVEAQQNNPNSLLWWMKRLIALRKQLPGVRPRARSSSCTPENRKVLAFMRRYEDETHPGGGQPVALRAVRRAGPRQSSKGMRAGRAVRPHRVPADRRAALLPDARRRTPSTGSRSSRPSTRPPISPRPARPDHHLHQRRGPSSLRGPRRAEDALPAYLDARHWFAGRAFHVGAIRIEKPVALGGASCSSPGSSTPIAIPSEYVLPLRRRRRGHRGRGRPPARAAGDGRLAEVRQRRRRPRRCHGGRRRRRAILAAIVEKRRASGLHGVVEASPMSRWKLPAPSRATSRRPRHRRHPLRRSVLLKIYRRLEAG